MNVRELRDLIENLDPETKLVIDDDHDYIEPDFDVTTVDIDDEEVQVVLIV